MAAHVFGLARFPATPAQVVHSLWLEGLLDERCRMMGATALFGYELEAEFLTPAALVRGESLRVLVRDSIDERLADLALRASALGRPRDGGPLGTRPILFSGEKLEGWLLYANITEASVSIPDPRNTDRSRFQSTNQISFSPLWGEPEVSWWESNMLEPFGMYPDDLAERLSASTQEPKTFEIFDLDVEANSFHIKVKGHPAQTGELWWHQRKLDLTGKLFEAERMVIPEARQGKGTGRLLMADLVETAISLGLRQIDIEAQDIGRYAWARFGFLPDRGSWRYQVAVEARRRLRRAKSDLHERDFADYANVLDSDDPKAIRLVASWRDLVTSTEFDANGNHMKIELGKALLLETPAQWFGSFDLEDPESMDIYREYVRSIP